MTDAAPLAQARRFSAFGRSVGALMEGQFGRPKVELSETDKTVTVSAELPGMNEKDVQVEIANGVLSIRGERKSEHNDEAWLRFCLPGHPRADSGASAR